MKENTDRIAIIIDPDLSAGFAANTIATIAIGLGAARPDFGNTVLTDCQERAVRNSANRPIPILQASADTIRKILLTALPGPIDAVIIPFPRFARSIHSFDEYRAQFPLYDLGSEIIDGLGLSGPDKWVRSLTGSLKLFR